VPGFFVRLLINALGIWLASEIVSGIQVEGTATLFVAALLLGIVNALVRPVAILLTFPLTIFSLGLFLLVINAGMLALVAQFVGEFQVRDFGSAFLGALIVSLTGWFSSRFVGPRGFAVEVTEYQTRS
jgi:putative membrane protein